MTRRWFWPLVISATLLFSLAIAAALSVVMLYGLHDQAPLRTGNDSVIYYTYYVDVHPALYVGLALSASLGAAFLVVAARLR